jgi:stearoyl-CoA desaturase (delta-9 desaturase)
VWRVAGEVSTSEQDHLSASTQACASPRPGTLRAMTRAERFGTLVVVAVPPLAVAAAIPLLWSRAVRPLDLALLVVMYALTGLGVTVGYHRLFTHRAFETSRWLRATFAVLGSMAVQGPVIRWVADHRKHHAFSDREGDPHSPHHGHAPGLLGGLAGLWHAHVGWLLESDHQAEPKYARDLLEDPVLRRLDRLFVPLGLLGLALPFLAGYGLTGSLEGGLTGLLWGGLVRLFLVHHVTWSVNSVCHFFGRRRFPTRDQSRNVFWLALPSLGEAWHHNHHAFPSSATHGLRWWEVDPSALVIRLLERAGLVWDVVRVSPERQQERESRRVAPRPQPAEPGP